MTSSADRPPVVIVGGGPGGLATAIALARRGQPVTVIEKRNWPVDKVCGEGVMPAGHRILGQLGVMSRLRAPDYFTFKGIQYIDESGLVAEAHFTGGAGAGIRRTVLSRALQQTAAAHNNIVLRPGCAVRGLKKEQDYVCLAVTGRVGQLHASLVIGADGLRSSVRRLAGLQQFRPVQQQRWGVRQHFKIEPWSDTIEVYWARAAEAYVTPLGRHLVQVAILWDRHLLPIPAKGGQLFKGLLQIFPQLAHRIADANPAGRAAAFGPMACRARSICTDRIILMGDALGFVDGITGEGISASLQQALVLGESLPQLIQDDRLALADLAPMGVRLQRVHRRRFAMTWPALLLTRHPVLRKHAIQGLAYFPGLFRRLIDFSMG